jgi:hypothetical protein
MHSLKRNRISVFAVRGIRVAKLFSAGLGKRERGNIGQGMFQILLLLPPEIKL